AVVSVDLRIVLPTSVKNGATADDHKYQEGPRLASLRGITMAKRKKVAVKTPADLGVEPSCRVKTVGMVPPPARQAGQIVDSPEALVERLATEAKVL
ncbi:MAG: electron transfer flavoprotein subunit beta/FixA family protein, partial [Myxococcota bacterium]